MKVLLVSHVSGFIPQFEMNNVRILQEMGYEVHYAANFTNPSYGNNNERLEGTGIVCHQIDFERSPFRLIKNWKAYHQLKDLMKAENFSLVHCHTPTGGAIARLAAHATQTGPVIYTAHGFHFYKGAPFRNWLLFYPVEKFLSRYTDVLITINTEDYKIASAKFHASRTEYVPGVGMNPHRFVLQAEEKSTIRRQLGLEEDDILLLSVGELNKNKNHEMVIRAIPMLENKKVHYWIAGHGKMQSKLEQLIDSLKLRNQVKLLGYQKEITNYYKAADIYILPSLREGLNISITEAMASALPIICSKIRGNTDLITDGICGYLVEKFTSTEYAKQISRLIEDKDLSIQMGQYNMQKVLDFSEENVKKCMEKIYEEL